MPLSPAKTVTASPRAIFVPLEDLRERGDVPDAPFTSDIAELAHAMATTLGSGNPPHACITVRSDPEPVLALLGFLPSGYEKRLERLMGSLGPAQQHYKYVGYGQAEKDAKALAGKLRDCLDRDMLASARFVAIPRGGLIVLGMLSYYLELNGHQLQDAEPKGAPLVIVDDCSLSGLRFRETLQRYADAPEIVFAHLYSHPALRQAIETEPQVSACVSARDLEDQAPDIYGEEYAAWQARWAERSAGHTYWNGLPERVGFAWSEPDINLWNETDRHAEQGWRLIPPEHCLKNRIAHESGPPVFIQPDSPGPLQAAPGVVYGPVDGHLLIARPDVDECFDLTGTAREMWQALIDHGSLEGACQALSAVYDVDNERLRNDIEVFAHQLLEHRLLTKSEATGQQPPAEAS